MRERQPPAQATDATDVSAQVAERFASLAAMRARFADLSEEQLQEDVAGVVAEVRAEARDATTPRTV